MKTSDIVERLLETDALTAQDGIYYVHEIDLEYLIDTIRDIMAEKPTTIEGHLDHYGDFDD